MRITLSKGLLKTSWVLNQSTFLYWRQYERSENCIADFVLCPGSDGFNSVRWKRRGCGAISRAKHINRIAAHLRATAWNCYTCIIDWTADVWWNGNRCIRGCSQWHWN
jgi:hypothetical protein